MKVVFISIAIIFTSIQLCYSQYFEEYQPLQSKGNIPDDFIKSSSIKYEEAKQRIDQTEKKSKQKTKQEYYIVSNFSIDLLLRSGYITFNDTLSQYVNRVADYLLRDHQDLRKKLRFYIVKNPEVNAYATDPGIILISAGLIAQLQTEAQLAFIMAHEIIHYKNTHMINSYLHTDELKKSGGAYSGASKELRLSAMFEYSKEHEKEADTEGLKEFYNNTEYSLNEVKKVFDVLLYSYLPIDEIDFNKSFFESEFMLFPDKYTNDEPKVISAVEDYDDSESTHPNIKKRRTSILEVIEEQDSKQGEKYHVGTEDEFKTIRKIARYELCSIFLHDLEYENAIYTAYVLIQNGDKDVKFLKKVIGTGLYGLSMYKNYRDYYKVHVKPNKVEGSKHQLNYLFKKITKKELNILALRYLWYLKMDYPDDNEINSMYEDLFHGLVYDNKQTPKKFYHRDPNLPVIDSVIEENADTNILVTGDTVKSSETRETPVDEEEEELDKYARIKSKMAQQELEEEVIDKKTGEVVIKDSALIDLFQYKEFRDKFQELTDKFNKEKDEENDNNVVEKPKPETLLNLDKIVIVNPFVFTFSKKKVEFLLSEEREFEFFEALNSLSKKVNLDTKILDSKTLSSSSIDQFNDYVNVSHWFGEEVTHEDKDVFNNYSSYMDDIVEKYGTKYFAWTGIYVVQERNRSQFGKFMGYAGTLFGLPIGFYNLISSKHSFFFSFQLIDIETGEVVFENRKYLKSDYKQDIFLSLIYDSLFQIRMEKKK